MRRGREGGGGREGGRVGGSPHEDAVQGVGVRASFVVGMFVYTCRWK